jgi:hypothetical protein
MKEEPGRTKAVNFIEKNVVPRVNQLLNSNPEAQALPSHPLREEDRRADSAERAQETVAEAIKKLMPTVTAKEFNLFMKVLFAMNKFKNGPQGAGELLEVVHTTIGLDEVFEPTAECVTRLILCTGSAALIFKHGADPRKITTYLCKKVFPRFEELEGSHQLSLLKLLAEISPYIKGHVAREVPLPSCSRAHSICGRARSSGVDWPGRAAGASRGISRAAEHDADGSD